MPIDPDQEMPLHRRHWKFPTILTTRSVPTWLGVHFETVRLSRPRTITGAAMEAAIGVGEAIGVGMMTGACVMIGACGTISGFVKIGVGVAIVVCVATGAAVATGTWAVRSAEAVAEAGVLACSRW